jgi:hypothetical protein
MPTPMQIPATTTNHRAMIAFIVLAHGYNNTAIYSMTHLLAITKYLITTDT